MTVVIEHVRHRVAIPPSWAAVWARPPAQPLRTACGRRFVPAHPVRDRRSIEHHEGPPKPITRCGTCWP